MPVLWWLILYLVGHTWFHLFILIWKLPGAEVKKCAKVNDRRAGQWVVDKKCLMADLGWWRWLGHKCWTCIWVERSRCLAFHSPPITLLMSEDKLMLHFIFVCCSASITDRLKWDYANCIHELVVLSSTTQVKAFRNGVRFFANVCNPLDPD